MLDKKRLGAELKRRRKMKKLTQNQLAAGICNQSEISRIEAGDFFPSIDVLYALANKLQLPITFFFEVLAHEEVEEKNEIQERVTTLSRNKDYQMLYDYIEGLVKNGQASHPEVEKYLLWQKFVAAYCLNKISADYCLTELFLLLRKDIVGMDILINHQIKNSIANILAENRRYNESMIIYEEILIDDISTKDSEMLKIKILFNYGKLLYIKRDLLLALKQADAGIDLSIKLRDISMLGQLYYLKASLMEELTYSFEEVAPIFKKSQFIFEMLNLTLYKQILEEEKSVYLAV